MTEDFNHLGTWLPAQLKAKKLGVAEFAAKAKISRSALYHFMSDARRPDDATIAKICKALGVPVEEGKTQYTPSKTGRPKGSRNRNATGARVEQSSAVAPNANR